MKIKNKKTISFSSILIILPQHASIHMERVGKVEREMEHRVPTPAPQQHSWNRPCPGLHNASRRPCVSTTGCRISEHCTAVLHIGRDLVYHTSKEIDEKLIGKTAEAFFATGDDSNDGHEFSNDPFIHMATVLAQKLSWSGRAPVGIESTNHRGLCRPNVYA